MEEGSVFIGYYYLSLCKRRCIEDDASSASTVPERISQVVGNRFPIFWEGIPGKRWREKSKEG